MKLSVLASLLLFASMFAPPLAADTLEARPLADAAQRIVLVRDGVTEPPMAPELAAQALRERIQAQGAQRLIVGLRVGSSGEPPASRRAMDTQTRAHWNADVEAAKVHFRSKIESRLLGEGDYYFQSLVALPYVAVFADREMLEDLLADPSVVSLNTEGQGEVLLNETLPLIEADDAHSSGYTGSGYSIAVIDTGVTTSHAMFSGKVVSEACYSTSEPGFNAACANSLPSGSTASGSGEPCVGVCAGLPGHGGHVAGIAVGASVSPGGGIPNLKGVGVAADLIPIQAMSQATSTDFRFLEADVASALGRVLQVASTYQVAAVNLSILLSGNSSDFSASACDSAWPAVAYAVALLNEAGVMVVAGSGNQGEVSAFQNKLGPPACLHQVVSVGASIKNAAGFMGYANAAGILDLLAPAGSKANNGDTSCDYTPGFTFYEATWSAYPFGGCSYMRLWGTSMAAPHVAGAAAVLRHKFPDASPTALRDQLKLTGTSVGFSQNGTSYTKPLINVFDALTPPSAPGTPASLSVASESCYGHYALYWSAASGSTEYQVEASPYSNYSVTDRVFVGNSTDTLVNVSSTTYYRVRACNTVSCSGWRNGGSAAVPLGYCI